MANEVTHLKGTGENHIGLQFIIVPTGKTYTTPETKTGILVFREEYNTIEVNGHLYHCDDINTTHANDFTNLAAALTSLKEAGLMTESGGIYTKSTPITVSETGISLGTDSNDTPITSGTIQQFLTALEGEIGAIRTDYVTHVNTVPITQNTHNVTITGNDINVGGSGDHASSTIDVAIEDLYTNISTTGDDGKLQLFDSTGATATTVIANGTEFRLQQGGTTYDASKVVAKFNIEKDSFVKTGEVVRGSYSNSTWTANASGEYYIHLTIGTTDGNETDLYIPAESLVDAYTSGSQSGDIVTINVDQTNNTVSATFAIASHSEPGTVTGTAAAANDVTKTSYVQVANSATVTTQDGGVTAVSVGAGVSADAAGAANAAYNDALGTSSDATTANTIYGAKALAAAAYAEAVKHTSVIGSGTTAASTHDYINVTPSANPNAAGGVEYVVKTNTNLDAAIESAETNAKNYADTIITWTIVDETAP